MEIFNNIGLKVIPVKADPGAIGGDLSHEFHLISESGDNNILYEKRIGDINNLDHNTSFSKLRNLYSVTEDEYNKKNKLPLDKLKQKVLK